MLEVQIKCGDAYIKVSGTTQKEVFGQLAKHQEIFNNTNCGCCKSQARFVVRNVEYEEEVKGKKVKKKADYYEMHCTNSKCRAKLALGLKNDETGDMFPKRKDENGYLPNNGWVKYEKNKQEEGA